MALTNDTPSSGGTGTPAGANQWDENAITAIVRKVLDEELRDRVNGVVDARIESETERRRWRREQGAF